MINFHQNAFMSKLNKYKVKETLILGLLSVVPYVSWAIYINYSFGINTIIQVAITQSALSFFLTIFLTQIVIYFYQFGQTFPVKLALATLGSSLFSNLFVYATHYFAGTPAIIMTMLPGSILGFIYAFIYCFRLAGKLSPLINQFKSRR